MTQLIIPHLSDKFTKLTQKKVQRKSLTQRSHLSVLTYVQSIDHLTFRQLQTLKHTLKLKRTSQVSALRNKLHKHKNVQFCDFVIQKQKGSVYLTKLNDGDSQQEWKHKTVLDRNVLIQIQKQLFPCLQKLSQIDHESFSTNQSFSNTIIKAKDFSSQKRIEHSNIRLKKKKISEIYKFNILVLIDNDSNVFYDPQITTLNPYFLGILAFLSIFLDELDKNRLLLKNILKQDIINKKFKIRLYNNKFQLKEQQILDSFQQQNETQVAKFMPPLVCRNGKLQIWNSILDKVLKERKVRNIRSGKDLVQMLLGVPVQIQKLQGNNFTKLEQFLSNRDYLVFGENKRYLYNICDVKSVKVNGEYCLLIILNSFIMDQNMSIKNGQIYKNSSVSFKMYVEKLENQNKMVVLFEDFIRNIDHLFRSTYIQNPQLLSLKQSTFIQIHQEETIIFASEQSINIKITKLNIPQFQETISLSSKFCDPQRTKNILYKRLQTGQYRFDIKSKYYQLPIIFCSKNIQISKK